MPGIGLAERVPLDRSHAGRSPSSDAGWLKRVPQNPRVRYLFGLLLLVALYSGVAQIGYALRFAGPVAAIVWLPVGVGIAFLYFGGLQFWPAVVAGDLLANDYGTLPLGSAFGQTCGNLLEVVVATVLLRRLVPRGDPLGTVSGLGGMLLAIAAGTAVSATIGSLSSLAGSVITTDAAPAVWRTWWLGDACGALIVLPLALAWAKPSPWIWWRRHGAELALVLAAVLASSEIGFHARGPVAYLVFPALIWAALRLGQRGATVAVAVAAGFAVWETTHHQGPFAVDSITDSVLSTQLYVAVSALSTLCLAAVVSEREAVAERLAASRARLVEAADNERRRIERNLHDGAQQRLTALVVRLRLAAAEARREPEGAADRLEEAGAELSAAIEEIRELAHGIHPSALTDYGLADAVQAMAASSTTPIRILAMPPVRLDAGAEATAYFVFSEAVANARKHSGATVVSVRATATHGRLVIEITDDGCGGAEEIRGSGLQGLRDRVEAIGGRFTVDSRRARGTRIVAAMPARAADTY